MDPPESGRLSRRRFLGSGAAVGAGVATAVSAPAAAMAASSGPGGDPRSGPLQVFVNNVGYETAGPKRFVVGASAGRGSLPFRLIDTSSGAVVHRGVATTAGPVEDWRQDSSPPVPAVYWTGDFSRSPGTGSM